MKKFVNEDQTEILLEVQGERLRQDLMYYKELRTPGQWQAILGKQIGQVQQSLLDIYFDANSKDNRDELRKQLIQVAAVAVAWVEQIDGEE